MNRRIFIVGSSRSGTTMMARILGRSPDVCDLGELHYLEQTVTGEQFTSEESIPADVAHALARRLLAVVRRGYFFASDAVIAESDVYEALGAVEDLTYADIYDLVTRHDAAKQGRSVPLDQTPRNLFYVDEIVRKFPCARVVCMLRDPRDVVLSKKGMWKRRALGGDVPRFEVLRLWANYHPFVAGRMWRDGAVVARRTAVRPEVMLVRFEQLLKDPEGTVAEIAAHCGIAYSPDMLQVEQIGSSSVRDRAAVKGIDRGRTGVWRSKLSKTEIALCEAGVRPLMTVCGYQESGVRANPLALLLWWIAMPAKLGLAFVLNFRRIRSLRQWFGKRFQSR